MKNDFTLIDRDWHKEFEICFKGSTKEILIICPFIKLHAIRKLFPSKNISSRIITRFNLKDFYGGVSDIKALEHLISNGVKIKGVKNLHAKLYIFDSKKVIIASTNLTQAALEKNFEFGILSANEDAIIASKDYFRSLWNRAGNILTSTKLRQWEKEVDSKLKSSGASKKVTGLRDYGANLGFNAPTYPETPIYYSSNIEAASQYFVKFIGKSNRRFERDDPVIEVIKRSACHWTCTYPKGKKPRKVKEGAVMFLSCLAKKPNDILIFGRAIGRKYVEGRDDATKEDIKKRSWKMDYPYYIRIESPCFFDGTLDNAISMNELMDKFKHKSFTSTERNFKRRHGNTNPKRAYMSQAAVELTKPAAQWLNERLGEKFNFHGLVSSRKLSKLD